MAHAGDTSLKFYQVASPSQWSFIHGLYDLVRRLKSVQARGTKKNGPAEFIKLDTWYHETLPKLVRSRKDPHMTLDELVQVTRWRMMRGKFRQDLLNLIRTNTELAVTTATKKSFKKVHKDLAGAIQSLNALKGMGTANASAILATVYPEIAPFMSDESMLAVPGIEEIEYTTNQYLKFVNQLNTLSAKLNESDPQKTWTPDKIQLTLWTHHIARELEPTLLDAMPKPNEPNGKLGNTDNDCDDHDYPSGDENSRDEHPANVNGHLPISTGSSPRSDSTPEDCHSPPDLETPSDSPPPPPINDPSALNGIDTEESHESKSLPLTNGTPSSHESPDHSTEQISPPAISHHHHPETHTNGHLNGHAESSTTDEQRGVKRPLEEHSSLIQPPRLAELCSQSQFELQSSSELTAEEEQPPTKKLCPAPSSELVQNL